MTQQPNTLIAPNAHETIIRSLHSKQAQNIEFTQWDDGSVTIEDFLYQFTEDPTLPHATLTSSQARALRKFLNRPAIKENLGIPQQRIENGGIEQRAQLGQHQVEVHEDQSLSIGNTRVQLDLDPGEAYRLFTLLRKIYK